MQWQDVTVGKARSVWTDYTADTACNTSVISNEDWVLTANTLEEMTKIFAQGEPEVFNMPVVIVTAASPIVL